MLILDEEQMRRAVRRLAMQTVEANHGTENLVLIGIRTRGVVLARRMHDEILRTEGYDAPLGILDISLYRDDLLCGCDALFKGSEMDFSPDGKNIALIDDVLYTGRTVRAALAALSSMGRAKSIRLYCLIDRGHRELPFAAEGVGKNVPTSSQEKIYVRFRETDGRDEVLLEKRI